MAVAASSGGEQIDHFLDRCIGTMIGRLEATIGSALSVGLVVEAAVGEGTALAHPTHGQAAANLRHLKRVATPV
jgi:hypothetical protein